MGSERIGSEIQGSQKVGGGPEPDTLYISGSGIALDDEKDGIASMVFIWTKGMERGGGLLFLPTLPNHH